MELPKYLLKKPLIWILVGVIVILLAISWYLGLRKPTSTLPQSSVAPPQIESGFAQPPLTYTYSGAFPGLPKQLPLYAETTPDNLNEDQAKQIAQQLGITTEMQILPDKTYGQVLFFYQDGKDLTFYLEPFTIQYLDPTTPTEQKLTEETLKLTAQQFLFSKRLLAENTRLALVKTDYLGRNEMELEPVAEFDQAQFVAFSYHYTLDSYPLIGGGPSPYPIKVILNLDGSVHQVLVVRLPQNLTKAETVGLRTPQAALAAMNQGKGIITQLIAQEDEYLEVETEYQLNAAQLNEVKLAYYFSSTQTLIQPVYVFTGTTEDVSGKTVKIEVLTPALVQAP